MTAKREYWKLATFGDDIISVIPGTGGIVPPSGDSSERPANPINGTIRYNKSTEQVEIYQNGLWSSITTTAISGEINTASNVGTGVGVFKQKNIRDFEFRTLIAGTNVSIVPVGDEIQISAATIGEINVGTNVGTGDAGIYDSKLGSTLNFRRLKSLSPALTITENGNVVEFDYTLTGVPITGATNLGSGSPVYSTVVGNILQLRTITASSPLSVSHSGTEINLTFGSNPVFTGTGSITLPRGSTAQRSVSPVNGMIRYNTTTNNLEAYINGTWEIITTATGTFVLKGGDSMSGTLTLTNNADLTLNGGDININSGDIIFSGNGGINMSNGGNITMSAGATVDGRDVSAMGAVVDNINTITSVGLVARTADPNTFARRTLIGNTNQISITNGDGVAGNPTISFASNPVFSGTGAITLPIGTTGQRPSASNGLTRINSSLASLEYYYAGDWRSVVGTIGGSITGDLNFDGGNITMSGNETVDGRDLSVDGVTIDQITAIAPGTGFLTINGSGQVIAQKIDSSHDDDKLGIVVNNGTGGDATPEVGLDIISLDEHTSPTSGDVFVVYDSTGTKNKKMDLARFSERFVNLSEGVIVVDDIAGFKALDFTNPRYANAKSLAILEEYRGGIFTLEHSGVEDNGITFASTDTLRYAKRVWDGINASAVWFGADPTGVNDSAPAVQAMIDANIRTIYFPDRPNGTIGVYFFNSIVKTPIGRSYINTNSSGFKFVGQSQRTTITRRNGASVNFTDDFTTAQARFTKAAIALCGSYCTVENLTFDDCYIGIYIGDDLFRNDVDWNSSDSNEKAKRVNASFVSVRNVLISNSGLGLFSESSKGNYYSHFDTVHFYQCQVGFASKDLPTGSDIEPKVNRNTFTNCRSNRCVVGAWFRDARTNNISLHTESCKLDSAPAHLQILPDNSDDGSGSVMIDVSLTTGAGIIVERSCHQNQFIGCVPESCDVDLFEDSTDNIYVACRFDDNSGKVIFNNVTTNDGLPYFYQSRRTMITPAMVYKPYGPGAGPTYPDWARNAGLNLRTNTQSTPFFSGPEWKLYSNLTNLHRYMNHVVGYVGDVESSGTFTLNLGTPRESNNKAQSWDIEIIANRGGSASIIYRFKVIAGNASAVWNKYAIVLEEQHLANGENTSAITTELSTVLSLSVDNELIATVTSTNTINDVAWKIVGLT